MKPTFLTLAVAAQLAAGVAFAETSTTATSASGSSVTSDTFGSDWSPMLGRAMFSADGTTVRSESEIENQWRTLSDDDKDMIRRDCEEDMKQSGGMTGSTGSATGSTGTGTSGTATGSTGTQSGTASGLSATGSNGEISVSHEQMSEICAVTKDL